MDIQLKHRIVGGIILLAVAVIILPMVFARSTESLRLSLKATSIPDKPRISSSKSMRAEQHADFAMKREKAMVELDKKLADPVKVMPTISWKPKVSSSTSDKKTEDGNGSVEASTDKKVEIKEPLKDSNVPTIKSTDKQTKTLIKVKAKHTSPKEKIASKTTQKPITKKTKATAVVKHTLTTGKAWAIQVATFSNSENAKDLEKKLRHQKYTAFIKHIKTKKGSLSQVLVGPVASKKQAAVTVGKLQSSVHLKGIIVAYHPFHTQLADNVK